MRGKNELVPAPPGRNLSMPVTCQWPRNDVTMSAFMRKFASDFLQKLLFARMSERPYEI